MAEKSLRYKLVTIADTILRAEDSGKLIAMGDQCRQDLNLLISQDQSGVLEAVTQLTGQQRLVIQRYIPSVPTPNLDHNDDVDGDGEETVVGSSL